MLCWDWEVVRKYIAVTFNWRSGEIRYTWKSLSNSPIPLFFYLPFSTYLNITHCPSFRDSHFIVTNGIVGMWLSSLYVFRKSKELRKIHMFHKYSLSSKDSLAWCASIGIEGRLHSQMWTQILFERHNYLIHQNVHVPISQFTPRQQRVCLVHSKHPENNVSSSLDWSNCSSEFQALVKIKLSKPS